jgi:hypothetical protein
VAAGGRQLKCGLTDADEVPDLGDHSCNANAWVIRTPDGWEAYVAGDEAGRDNGLWQTIDGVGQWTAWRRIMAWAPMSANRTW